MVRKFFLFSIGLFCLFLFSVSSVQAQYCAGNKECCDSVTPYYECTGTSPPNQSCTPGQEACDSGFNGTCEFVTDVCNGEYFNSCSENHLLTGRCDSACPPPSTLMPGTSCTLVSPNTPTPPPPTPTPPPGCIYDCGDGLCCGTDGETGGAGGNCIQDCGGPPSNPDCYYCVNPVSCVYGDPGGTVCGCASCSLGRIGVLVFVDQNGNSVWDGDGTDSRVSTGGGCTDSGVADTLMSGLQISGSGASSFTENAAGDCDILNNDRPGCATSTNASGYYCNTNPRPDFDNSGRCCPDSCWTCPGWGGCTTGVCVDHGHEGCPSYHSGATPCGGKISESCYSQEYGTCSASACGSETSHSGQWYGNATSRALLYGRIFERNVPIGPYALQLLNLPSEYTIVNSPGVINVGTGDCEGPHYFALRFDNVVPEPVDPIIIYPPDVPVQITGVDRHTCYDDPPHAEATDLYKFISTHEDGDGSLTITEVGLEFADESYSNRIRLVSTGTGNVTVTRYGVANAMDMASVDVVWNYQLDGTSIIVVWDISFVSSPNNWIYDIWGMTQDENDSGGIWNATGDQFKIWDCEVNLFGSFYDISADYPSENCSSMYCAPIIPYGSALVANFIASDLTDVTPGSVTLNFSGLDNLIYRESYRADVTGTDVQVGYSSFADLGGCSVCGGGADVVGTCCDMAPFEVFEVGTGKGVNPYDNDPRITINVGVLGMVESWYQLEDSSARSRASIVDTIPESCVANGSCDAAITVGRTYDNGPLISNNSISNGDEDGVVMGDPNNWVVATGGLIYSGDRYDYDYFDGRITTDVVDNAPAGTDYYRVGAGEFSSWNDYLPTGFVGGTDKVIMLVDDDVIVDIDIVVAGEALLLLISSGDITIDEDVDAVDGVFVADGLFSVEDSPTETQLSIEGVVVGDADLDGTGGVVFGRDRGVWNLTSPGVVFGYRPDMLFALPVELEENSIEWREIIPE